MLISMALLFVLVDWIYCLALPLTLLRFSITTDSGKAQTEEITAQLLSDLRMQLALCFVLLMLVFYYKLSIPKEYSDDSVVIHATSFERFDVQAPL